MKTFIAKFHVSDPYDHSMDHDEEVVIRAHHKHVALDRARKKVESDPYDRYTLISLKEK